MPDQRKAQKLAQMKAVGYKDQKKWAKNHLRTICVNMNRETDADIIAFWDSLPKDGKADFFRALMREQIKKGHQGGANGSKPALNAENG